MGTRERELRDWVIDWVARNADVPRNSVDTDRPFGEYGLSSVKLVSLSGELGELLGLDLPVDIAYGFPTVSALAGRLAAEASEADDASDAETAPGPASDAETAPGPASDAETVPGPAAGDGSDPEPVAVVGVGCRFPGGVRGPDEFWRFLLDGGDGIRRVPEGRWADVPDGDRIRAGAAGLGGFLDGIDRFDAAFFGVSPREAETTDPQQRLVLEVAWEALEHAGVPPHTLEGRRAGVFLGAAGADYAPEDLHDMGGWSATGASMGVIASRLSYLLGSRGPSMLVDTACSASLVAVHLACQSLRAGECEIALAGGVNALLTPAVSVAFEEAGVLSPDGRCRTFDAGAHGYGRAEGSGIVVLKRLSDALRDGDRVLAVVRGSAVNHNGRSNGLMAPSPVAQAELLRVAYENAGVDPGAVDYLEAHGTGTAVGDPIEIGAVTTVTGAGRDPDRPLLLGAVKTNLGHLEAAAGIAGFIKTALALHHGEIPPNLNFASLNPAVPADAPIRVVTERTPWPSGPGRRTAGVSAFGFGGANAHVVLEEAPRTGPAPEPACPRAAADGDGPDDRCVVVTVDGSSPRAYRAEAGRLRDWLAEHREEVSPASLAHTTTVRRSHGPLRGAVVARDTDRLLERLGLLAAGEEGPGVVTGAVRDTARPVFVFSGQGSQWAGMARELLTGDPAFAEALDELDAFVRKEAGFSVRELLADPDEGALEAIDVVQPVLFAVQVALAAAWRARGVEPVAVIGHSMGEAAAAVVSGALSPEDGARVTCRRSRLMRRLAGRGAMAVVAAPSEEVEEFVAERGLASAVTVAVRLSPGDTVVSGDRGAVESLLAEWEERGVDGMPVKVDVASHSPQVDGILGELAAELADLRPRPPRIPLYSTVAAGREERMDARYWVDNLRQPVMLADAVRAAAEDGHEVFVEVSPHPVLVRPVRDTLNSLDLTDAVVRPTLRRDEHPVDVLAEGAALLHCHGHRIDWDRVWIGGELLSLPPRHWDHDRSYWLDRTPAPAPASAAPHEHPLLGRRTEPADRPGTVVWEAALTTADLPWLADHEVAGERTLPAGVHAELALAAGRATGFRHPVVRDLALHTPVAPPAGEPLLLQTVCRTDAGAPAATVQVFARTAGAGEWQQCASARIHAAPSSPAPGAAEPLAATTVTAEEHYAAAERDGVVFGGGLRTVRELRAGSGRAEAVLRLPGGGGDPRFTVHPALLTGALETLGAAAAGLFPHTSFTVAGIGSLRTVAGAGPVTRATATVVPDRCAADGVEGDCVLWCDDTPVAELAGVRLARVANGNAAGDANRNAAGSDDLAAPPPEWSLDLVWRPAGPRDGATAGAGAPQDGEDWVVVGEHPALIAGLRDRGVTCRVVPAPPHDGGDGAVEEWTRRLGNALDAGPADRVLFAAGLAVRGSSAGAATALTASAVTVVRALDSFDPSGTRSARLHFLTCGAQHTGREDTLHPAQAVLWGLGRSVALEHPGLWGSLVDLDPADPGAWAGAVHAAVRGAPPGDQSAYRAGERLVPRLVRHAPEPDAAPAPRRAAPGIGEGSHLVVGATGALGPHLVRQLVAMGARCLVLLSRRPAPGAPDGAGAAGLPAGVRVVRVTADVADQEAMEELFARFGNDLPPLRAVHHAAFARSVVPVREMTRAHIDGMFRAKVAGTALLTRLAADHGAEDVVCVSSTTGLLGSGGLAHYAAGSCYLDALGRAWNRRGLPVRVLVLGPCGEGLAGTPEEDTVRASGLRLMPGRRALAAVRPLLADGREYHVVADADWPAVDDALSTAVRSPLLDDLLRDGGTPPADGRAAHTGPDPAPAPGRGRETGRAPAPADRPAPRTRRELEDLVRREVAAAMGCEPEAVRTRQNLFAAGMDSLMSLVVLRRLRTALALDLGPRDLHRHPTVASLAAFLQTNPSRTPERAEKEEAAS
ncbi:phthiocerol type I polyketide synthase PpsD [Streptomyces glaucosporus]|uniref:Phthiocerol type I polyketide synthase PpsD n=1 Tax=Streptomyces glaucosporus TaxID=284044 RepID=A0ABP5UJX1_9ACTN